MPESPQSGEPRSDSARDPSRTIVMLLRASGLLATALAVLGGYWLYRAMPRLPDHAAILPENVQVEPPRREVAAFSLTERNGETITREDLRGKPWVVSFIFTTCAGPCPRVTGQMRILQDRLTNADVRLVTLTVDPERDTPEVLSKYADAHGADPDRWLFLTGSRQDVYDLIIGGFQMPVEHRETDVIHTTNIIYVDAEGFIAGKYNAMVDADMAELRRILNGPAGAGSAEPENAAVVVEPQPAPEERFLSDFELVERSGRKVTKADLLGKPTAICFVFVRCAGPCPRVSGQMRMLQDRLKDYDVRLVTLTVDPKHDTPELLAKYADNFGADESKWWFLTGDELEIYSMIGEDFQMPVFQTTGTDRKPGFEVIHTFSVVHVSAAGKVMESYNALDDAEMSSLRRALIAEAEQLQAKKGQAEGGKPEVENAEQPAPPALPEDR